MAEIASTILSQLGTPEYVKLKVEFEVELSLEDIQDIGDASYDFWSVIIDNDPEPIIKVIKTDKMRK